MTTPPPFDHPAAEILWLIRQTRMRPLVHDRGAPGAPPDLLHDLTAATLLAYWNELAFDGKPNTDDAIKVRFGAFRSEHTGYICAIVMDVLEGGITNPRRIEKGIIALKLDSTAESRAAGLPSTPMIEVFLHKYGDGSTQDSDMKRVMSLSVQEIVLWSPVRFEGYGVTTPPPLPLPVDPTLPPPPPPPPPPPAGFVYRPVVKGVAYSFRAGHWEDISAVFRFPVDDDVVAAYTRAPSDAGWVAVVDRMFMRRDD